MAMTSKDCVKAIGMGCATAICVAMLLTDGAVAASIAVAVAGSCAGLGTYVGKKE